MRSSIFVISQAVISQFKNYVRALLAQFVSSRSMISTQFMTAPHCQNQRRSIVACMMVFMIPFQARLTLMPTSADNWVHDVAWNSRSSAAHCGRRSQYHAGQLLKSLVVC